MDIIKEVWNLRYTKVFRRNLCILLYHPVMAVFFLIIAPLSYQMTGGYVDGVSWWVGYPSFYVLVLVYLWFSLRSLIVFWVLPGARKEACKCPGCGYDWAKTSCFSCPECGQAKTLP